MPSASLQLRFWPCAFRMNASDQTEEQEHTMTFEILETETRGTIIKVVGVGGAAVTQSST